MTINIPPLPEGWAGTPDDLIDWINENGGTENSASVSGDAIPGQIGGSAPTEDVGIYFSYNSIEIFRDGRYHVISDVPIGGMIMYAAAVVAGNEPDNYLLCDGRSLLRSDYADLYSVIGTVWGSDSGTTFSLPKPQSRMPYGVGQGDYADNQLDALTGKIREVALGDYLGREWARKENKITDAPTTMNSVAASTLITGGLQYLATYPPGFGVHFLIRYR